MVRTKTVRLVKGWVAQAAHSLFFLLWAGTVLAADVDDATLDAALIQTKGMPSVGAGRFYGYRTATEGPGDSAFTNVQALARAEDVPLVVVWSNKGCSHCAAFARELNANIAAVTNWLAETRAVFAYFKDVGGQDGPTPKSPRACHDAYDFAAQTCKAQPAWPLFAFWYERADGTAVTWGGAFDTSGDTRTFAKLKSAFAAWAKANGIVYKGGRFAATGTGSDRYEAEAATPTVEVELVRDAVNAPYAATNTLDVIWPAGVLPAGDGVLRDGALPAGDGVLRDGALPAGDGVLRDGAASPSKHTVIWQPGVTAQRVVVDLAQTTRQRFPVGESLALILRDARGGIVESNAIHFVEDEISAGCPLWKTDRTAETLDFGEWTADYATALAKVSASSEDAYVLVSVQGTLWCPDCARTEANFLDLEDDTGANCFRAWAKTNRIALVVVDIPNYNGPSVTNRTRATLFTREAFPASDGTWCSGRAYLSRKAISDVEADATVQAFHRLASTNTAQGGFHRPEDRNANRTGVPIFVLVRKDGTVAGRFTRFASVSPRESDRVHFNAYVHRIEELVALDREGAEIENNHGTSTSETLAPGAMSRGTLCAADTADAFRITGAAPGAQIRLTLARPADETADETSRQVTLKILAADAAGMRTLASTNGVLLASTNGVLSDLTLDVTLDAAENWYAVVGHDDEADGFQTTTAGSTVAAYTLRCDVVLLPDDGARTVVPPEEGTVLLRVEREELYRITGIDSAVDGLTAVSSEENLYRATRTGDVRLKCAEGYSEISYQRWQPGAIAFASAIGRVIEYAGTGTVAVVRTGGASGEVRVTVRRASGEDDGGRVDWSEQTLVWADGESGVRNVGFAVRADEVSQGDTALSLYIETVADGCLAALKAPTNCVITVVDTDAPCLERLSYDIDTLKGFTARLPFSLINVREGDVSVRISKVRGSSALPSGMKIRYDAASGEAVLEGVPTRPGTYTFTCVVSARRDGRNETGFETTFRIVVRDPAETNPFLGIGRPRQRLDFDADVDGVGCAAGFADFAVTSAGRISARYAGAGTRRPVFAGNWQRQDADGAVFATLVASSGETLDVAMDANGYVTLVLDVGDGQGVFAGMRELTAAADWPATDIKLNKAFKGQYNVAVESLVDGSPNGYLAVRASGTGTVRYAGVLPDGTTVSGSTALGRMTEKDATVHVFTRTTRNVFGAILRIDADGAKKWASGDVLVRELVNAEPGTAAYVLSRMADEPVFYGIYGSYFEARTSPVRFDAFYDDTARFAQDYTLAFGGDAATLSGTVTAGTSAFKLERQTGLSFTYSRQTGMFSGLVRVRGANGRTTTGRYRGLVVPGWVLPCECGIIAPEKPFGTGVLLLKGEASPVVLQRNTVAE